MFEVRWVITSRYDNRGTPYRTLAGEKYRRLQYRSLVVRYNDAGNADTALGPAWSEWLDVPTEEE